MINTTNDQYPTLDRITRITTVRERDARFSGPDERTVDDRLDDLIYCPGRVDDRTSRAAGWTCQLERSVWEFCGN